jgi:hypothetical protein
MAQQILGEMAQYELAVERKTVNTPVILNEAPRSEESRRLKREILR